MKVLVVAEYYPRAGDPVRGVWAHRQAVAARAAGAEVRVLVLHRPVPPLRAVRERDLAAIRGELSQPARAQLDGIEVEYVRYASPPRPWSYGTWGAWAAPALGRAIARIRRDFTPDLVHAHYAVPAGDAVRRAAGRLPLVVSVHGGDVYAVAGRRYGARAVRATFGHARLVLANSAGTAARCRALGAERTRVVHLGTDLPPASGSAAGGSAAGGSAAAGSAASGLGRPGGPLVLAAVAHLVARKRLADLVEAFAALAPRHPELRLELVGDGPERAALAGLAAARGVAGRLRLHGALPPAQAAAVAQRATLFVLPSVDEAFGVAYVEAMAAGVPAIGCRGEAGPEEIAAAGGGIVLVPPRDPAALAAAIDALLRDRGRREELGRAARATVVATFTWERCGAATLTAYRDALAKTRF